MLSRAISANLRVLVFRIPQLSLVTPAYDIWGLGCILSEMVTMKLLRQDRCHQHPLSLNRPAYERLMKEMQVAHHGAFAAILQRLLEWDPMKRAPAEKVAIYARECLGMPSEQQHVPQPVPPEMVQLAAKLGISQAECHKLFSMFTQADTDKKGYITVSELHAVLALLKIQASTEMAVKTHGPPAPGVTGLTFTQFLTWWAAKDKEWMPTVQPDNANPEHIVQIFRIEADAYAALQEGFKQVSCLRPGSSRRSKFLFLSLRREVSPLRTG